MVEPTLITFTGVEDGHPVFDHPTPEWMLDALSRDLFKWGSVTVDESYTPSVLKVFTRTGIEIAVPGQKIEFVERDDGETELVVLPIELPA